MNQSRRVSEVAHLLGGWLSECHEIEGLVDTAGEDCRDNEPVLCAEKSEFAESGRKEDLFADLLRQG